MELFVGRKKELESLEGLWHLRRACIVVIRGRRRVGKSRLAKEFANGKQFIEFTGLAPIHTTTAQDQRDTFASQLGQNLKLPMIAFRDWSDAFFYLSHHIGKTPTVVLFDEISWMGSQDPTFLSKLKAWWDLNYLQHPNLILILCGSVSTWIEKNILKSTAFFGRISLTINLEPLSLPECALFLDKIGFKGSAYEIFKILSILGGVPWYLEQINPNQMADTNIKHLCFKEAGLLVTEFDNIFHDLFNGLGYTYKKILHILADGMKLLKEIRQKLGWKQGGNLSEIMRNLITSDFVTPHYQWSFKTGNLGNQSLYRLSDLYTRFYIKYIEPERNRIQSKAYGDMEINQLPGWQTMMGFQLESLLLQNRPLLLKTLQINPADVVADNPYCQMPTSRQEGCQIDYLIQTSMKNLFFCEFKFTLGDLGMEVIKAMRKKIERFSIPRGHAAIPVLFYLGDISEKVYDERYFYRMIDISEFLTFSK